MQQNCYVSSIRGRSQINKQNGQNEEIFEGHGETKTDTYFNKRKQNETSDDKKGISESILIQILSLLEDLKDEQNMRKRYLLLSYPVNKKVHALTLFLKFSFQSEISFL